MYKAQVKPRYWSSGWGDRQNVSLRLLFSVVNAGVDCCAPSSALLVRFGGLVKEQKDSVKFRLHASQGHDRIPGRHWTIVSFGNLGRYVP